MTNNEYSLQNQLNKILNILRSTEQSYQQMSRYSDDQRRHTMYLNIAKRRKILATEIQNYMDSHDLLIDKRTWSSAPTLPSGMDKGLSFANSILSVEQQLLDLYKNISLEDNDDQWIEEHQNNIRADIKQITGKSTF